MEKKYIVRLDGEERAELEQIASKLSGSSQKVRRANMLLQADVNGPGWTDKQIAEAYRCRTKTVENVRQRFVERGFRETLEGRRPENPPRSKLLDGKQEAKIIATRLGNPPEGYANWTLRLLARKVVELEIAEAVSPQTVMRTLKKWNDQAKDSVLGDPAGVRRRVCGQHGRRAERLRKAV